MTAVQEILAQLRERGVALRVVDGFVHYSPRAAVTPELLARMAACKPELIALLRPTAPSKPPTVKTAPTEAPIPEFGDGDRPNVTRCPDCHERDFMRPRLRGTWCCARCYPYEGLAPADVEWWPQVTAAASLDVMLGAESARAGTGPCACCGETSWWRLKTGGPWACARCHPPQPGPEVIERASAPPTIGSSDRAQATDESNDRGARRVPANAPSTQ